MENIARIKIRKYFLLLGIIPSIIFMSIVIYSIAWMTKIHVVNTLQSDLNSAYHIFYGALYQEARMIDILTRELADDKNIQSAFSGNDRELLLRKVRPMFQQMRGDYHMKYLYFHSLDRTNFLRAYAPNHYGDIVNRFTLQQAEQTGTISYGLELGKLEGLTLRVVLPWRVDNQIIGYIEMAKEVDWVLEEMKTILDLDLMLIVDKNLLDEKLWQAARQRGNVAGDWGQFPDSVIVGTTFSEIPPILDKDLSLPHHEHSDTILEINAGGRHYRGGFAPLLDASDKDIGDIVIVKDITEVRNINARISNYLLGGYSFSVLCYLVFVFIFLHHLKHRPHNSRVTDVSDA
jgi:hypothetical protein